VYAVAMVRLATAIILLIGCALLGYLNDKNPDLFSAGPSLFVKIWIGLVLFFFALSAINKVTVVFNKIFRILPLAALIVFTIWLASFFGFLFVDTGARVDSTGSGIVIILMLVWLMWDLFILAATMPIPSQKEDG